MNTEEYFTYIEEEKENTNSNEVQTENSFIKSLPEWDLEPPYDTIRRENN